LFIAACNSLKRPLKYLFFFIKHTPMPLSRGDIEWYFKGPLKWLKMKIEKAISKI
jgi:hypothetical protein